jgi:hypothetical protein
LEKTQTLIGLRLAICGQKGWQRIKEQFLKQLILCVLCAVAVSEAPLSKRMRYSKKS